MAERVVHMLEVIQIQEDDGQGCLVVLCQPNGLLSAFCRLRYASGTALQVLPHSWRQCICLEAWPEKGLIHVARFLWTGS